MPVFSASVPGKIILFGEHAVVYGYPAIAVPVSEVRVKAIVSPRIGINSGEIMIHAPDVGIHSYLDDLAIGNPLVEIVHQIKKTLDIERFPSCNIDISSTIPVAAGLGSGAAVSAAIIRALSGFMGYPLPDESVSRIAFEIEKLHHGTPSGIDNTVVVYNKPVYFIKDQPIEHIDPSESITIVIGDTGIQCPTKETVGEVREKRNHNTETIDRIFSAIGSITKTARQSIEGGYPDRLGPLMDENHQLLKELGMSSQELDHLVAAAKGAGALGAKLSGGGKGGNIVALVKQSNAEKISTALTEAGAVKTFKTLIKKTEKK